VADRSVKVTVGANLSGLISEFQKGQKAATGFSQSLRKSLAGDTEQMRILGTGFTAIGALAGAGVGLAVSKFAEFDSAMSSVQAATHESAGSMAALRDAALEAGSTTVFNATESANAIEELAKAGLSTADILGGGLKGSLDLAAAGGLGVARAAEVASTTLQQFSLGGDKAGHVADVLAAGAGKAMGSVEDLANGLKFVGPVAASMGVSLEETTAVLALFAQQGIIGEQAGTGLRGVLASLTAPSGAAAQEIERLGLNLYDAQGNFLGMQNAAGQLSAAYGDMDEKSRNASLGVIFGRESVTAATALYQAGSEGVAQWTSAVDDSGYAAETARLKLDNLKGDVEALGGALETALIKTGSGANGPLRELTQGLTGAVEAYGNLDPAVQGANLALASGVAAVGTAGGAFLLAAPKVLEFQAAVKQLGPGAEKASKALVGLGKAAAIGTAVVGVALAADKLASAGDRAALSLEQTSEALRSNDIDSLFSGLGQDVDSYADSLRLLTGNDVNSSVERFGSTLNGALFGGAFSDQVSQTKDQLDTLGQSLGDLVNSGDGDRAADMFERLADKAAAEGVSRNELLDLLPAYRDALSGVTGEQEAAAGSTQLQADALSELSGTAQTAEGDIADLASAISGFGEAQFDVNSTTRDFQAAIDDATASLETNGQTLDVGTEAGRANGDALDRIAQSALSMSAAIVTQTGDQQAASAAILQGREAYIQASIAAGVSEEAANAYADQLGLIPSNVSTAIGATGVTKTQAEIDAIQLNLAQTIRQLTIQITAAVNRGQLDSLLSSIRTARAELSDLNGASSGNGRMGTYATGGPVYGAGTGTSDSIPAWLSNGEHVLTAREVLAAGGHGNVMAWRREILSAQRMPAFAAGGPVNASAPVRYAAAAPQVVITQQGGGREVYAPVNVTAAPNQDAAVVGTLAGREIGRYLAGVVL
jgi:TP901 family phage tail tape measure protein